MRHIGLHLIVLVLCIVILVPTVHSAFANNAKPHGVTYYTNENAYPSYFHLLTPSDRALVQKAQADIERYRKSNVTITIVDENGNPMEDVEVAFNQTDHNFLFGFQDFDPFLFDSAGMMKEAGFNLFVTTPYWVDTELSPGNYSWNYLETQRPGDVRNMGFTIKVHPMVYHAPWNVPSFLKKQPVSDIKNETLTFMSAVLDKIPYADIYELSNEANWQEWRAGFTIDQYIQLLREASSVIRTARPNATVTVNTAFAFDEDPSWLESGYNSRNLSPYEWYKLLISAGLDFDVIGIQYRPGYFCHDPPYCGSESLSPSLTDISTKFDRFAALGKRVHITELAVPSCQLPEMKRYDNVDWNATVQAAYVEGFYTLIFAKPAADSVNWWMLSTAMPTMDESIGPSPFERRGSSLVPRASYYTLKHLITDHWSTRGIGFTDPEGRLVFSGFGGDYAVALTYNGLTEKANIRVRDGASSSFEIEFDGAEALLQITNEKQELQSGAQSILREIDRIRQWSENVNPIKSVTIYNAQRNLDALYRDGEFSRVIEAGKALIDNPFQIQLSGLRSDLEGFTPIMWDSKRDTSTDSPAGTDVRSTYAFADSNNLYLGITVLDERNKILTYTTELLVYSQRHPEGQRFHASVSNGTKGSCWEEPWQEGNVLFGCAYALGEIIQMRVPLSPLGHPERILLNNAWVWQESTRRDFDSYDGPYVEIPNLRNFKTTSTPQIETTAASLESTAATTQATGVSSSTTHAQGIGESQLPYIAAICIVVVLGTALYWRRSRRRESEK